MKNYSVELLYGKDSLEELIIKSLIKDLNNTKVKDEESNSD